MSTIINTPERQTLEATLRQRQQALTQQLDAHQEGQSRVEHAHELLSHEDIDGGLIGGASLDPKALMEIVHAANQE